VRCWAKRIIYIQISFPHTHTHTPQSLKSEYNTLAPVYGTCSENGQSLAEQCEDTPARADLEARLGKLQSEWERLGQQFGEVLQKLSDALVQVC